jgi:hypothetical protein
LIILVFEEEEMSRHQKAGVHRRRPSRPVVIIKTTLYELIATVIDTVGPDEKQSVTPVMLELLGAFCPHVNVVDA